jgi:uncharacterized membrane protein
MTRNTLGIASILVILTMLGLSFLVGSGLPDGIPLPIHWNLAGEADGFASEWPALLMPAGIMGAVALLFYFLPALEPRREGLERSRGLYLWGWASLLFMGAAIQFVVIAVALGWPVRVNHVIVGAIGVMIFVIGNQLGKSRSMYLVGIRTPWTLASEEVWIRTHRLGGKLMVLAGLAMIGAAVLPLPAGLLWTIPAVAIAFAALVPIAYSYLLWRREQAAGQPSG